MNEKDNKTLDELSELFQDLDMPDETRKKIYHNILKMRDQNLNVLITGATGSGKSSTINALFGSTVAKVGCTPDPETKIIDKYYCYNMTLWDTPGLGDGVEEDIKHAKIIIDKLNEVDENGDPLIDLVLVILDGSSRDMGTSYQLINEVIAPNLGKEKDKRLLVAINQADVAMKGRNWDYELNKPNDALINFLDEKADSVKKRVKEGSGLDIEPIYYSAGYTENGIQQQPYNLSKLLYYIIKNIPMKKRLILAGNTNQEEQVWSTNDDIEDYNEKIQKSFIESIVDGVEEGADIGGRIGEAFGGSVGEKVGKVVGGVVGGVVGFFKSIFS